MDPKERKRVNAAAAAAIGLLVAALLASCSDGGVNASASSAADCVLSNVGSAQTDAAVVAIQHACHDKFPPSQSEIDAAISKRVAREQAQREAEAFANAAADAAAAAAASAADSNSL